MSESTYKLRKRIKELESQLLETKKERNNFRDILMVVFDEAIKFDSINSKWILHNLKRLVFQVKHW